MSHSPPVNLFPSWPGAKEVFWTHFPAKGRFPCDSPPRETNGWGNSLPGVVKIQGKKTCGAQSTSLIHFTQECVNVPKDSQCSRAVSALTIPGKSSPRDSRTSHSEHEEHFEVSFLFQTVLGSLKSDCKVMVYFSTSAWLRNEEYLNDEGSMINRVVIEWLCSSPKTELSQSPNWINTEQRHETKVQRLEELLVHQKNISNFFLTKQFTFFSLPFLSTTIN